MRRRRARHTDGGGQEEEAALQQGLPAAAAPAVPALGGAHSSPAAASGATPASPRHTKFRRDATFLAVFILRTSFFLLPASVIPLGLHKVLDCDAHAGILGLAQDLLRLAWGSRVVALLALALMAPLPLHLHLVAQAVGCVLMARSAPALCQTQLMSHPLMSQRFSELNLLLSSLSQPLGTWSLALVAALEVDTHHRGCRIVLAFLSASIGIILSTAALMKIHPGWQEGPESGGDAHPRTWAENAENRVRVAGNWLLPPRATSPGNDASEGSSATCAAEGAGRMMPTWQSRAFSCWLILCAVWAMAVAVMAAAQDLQARRSP